MFFGFKKMSQTGSCRRYRWRSHTEININNCGQTDNICIMDFLCKETEKKHPVSDLSVNASFLLFFFLSNPYEVTVLLHQNLHF